MAGVTVRKHSSAVSAASALFAGLVFGAGLIVSGMSDPRKVKGFLDIAGDWDPSLAFVMLGAIGVASLAFEVARRRRAGNRTALLGDVLPGTPGRIIDAPLLLGAAAFGVGWGLAGFCPGPAVVAAAAASPGGVLFLLAMLVGMLIHALIFRWRRADPQVLE